MRALCLVLLALVWLPACSTRTSNHTVIETHVVRIDLRSEKPFFSRKALPRGFDQPLEISPARMEAILAGIQIDIRPSDRSAIRERRYAIPKKILPKMADAMSEAFAEASPDQELVVLALRKQMQKGIFNRKYLTSLIAYVEGGEMYIHLSRIDWKTEEHRAGAKLPYPQIDEVVMPFATVPTESYATAGQQAVKVDWQSTQFGPVAIEQNVAGSRPGAAPEADAATTSGDAAASSGADEAAEATVIVEETVVVEDAAPSADAYRGLTPDDLRKLADLEEDRAAGRIDVGEYEVRRRAILDGTP